MKISDKTFSFQKKICSLISMTAALVMLLLCCSCAANDSGDNHKSKNKNNSSDHLFSISDTDDDDFENNKEKSGYSNELPENSSSNVQIVTVTSIVTVTVTVTQETITTASETAAVEETTKSTKKTVTTNRTESPNPTTVRTEAVKTTDNIDDPTTQRATQAATAPPKTTTVLKTTARKTTFTATAKTTAAKSTKQAVKTTATVATTPSQTQKQPEYGVDYTIDTSKTGRDSAKASEIAKCINILRNYVGVSRLSYSKDLEKAAMVRAEEIVNNFSHQRPDGASGISAIWQYTSRSHYEGENIGQCGAVATAEFMYSLWLNSPNHYKIMTDPGFSRCGVGVYYKNGSTYTVLLVAGD